MPHAIREERAKCHVPDPDVSESLIPLFELEIILGNFHPFIRLTTCLPIINLNNIFPAYPFLQLTAIQLVLPTKILYRAYISSSPSPPSPKYIPKS
jgi:hypothetical protein